MIYTELAKLFQWTRQHLVGGPQGGSARVVPPRSVIGRQVSSPRRWLLLLQRRATSGVHLPCIVGALTQRSLIRLVLGDGGVMHPHSGFEQSLAGVDCEQGRCTSPSCRLGYKSHHSASHTVEMGLALHWSFVVWTVFTLQLAIFLAQFQ